MKLSAAVCVVAALVAAGCTTLGPMPGMTMANPLPTTGDRPGVELQAGMVPGFYMSQGVEEQASEYTVQPQYAGWFEPGSLLGPASGLGVGLRFVGGGGNLWEPMVRYRLYVDDDERVALSVVGFGTYAEGSDKGASYSMGRGGAEVTFDARLTPKNRWAELHVSGGVSVTGVGAEGRWCSNPATGWAQRCEDGEATDVHREITTALPAAFIGLSADLFRDVPVFHGLRIGAWFAGGIMPELRSKPATEDQPPWVSAGMSVTAGLGAW